MYERAGFTEVKRDSFVRSIVGLDRRFLMSKPVPRASSGSDAGVSRAVENAA